MKDNFHFFTFYAFSITSLSSSPTHNAGFFQIPVGLLFCFVYFLNQDIINCKRKLNFQKIYMYFHPRSTERQGCSFDIKHVF